MGKASERRKRNRREYLARLANEDPELFLDEWMKRLDSWARDARRRATSLVHRTSPPSASVFDMVDDVVRELVGCGEEAINLVGESTRETIQDVCTMAASRVLGIPYRMKGPIRPGKNVRGHRS